MPEFQEVGAGLLTTDKVVDGVVRRVPEIAALRKGKEPIWQIVKTKEGDRTEPVPGVECALELQRLIEARKVVRPASVGPDFATVANDAVNTEGPKKVRDELVKAVRERGPKQLDLFYKTAAALAAAVGRGVPMEDAIHAISHR